MTTVWANVVYLLTWPYFAVVLLLLPLVCFIFFFLLALMLVVLLLPLICCSVLLLISNSIFQHTKFECKQTAVAILDYAFAPVCAHFSIVYIFILQISICTHIRTHTRPHWRTYLFAGFGCSFMTESTLAAKIKIKKTTSERHVQC